MMFLVWVERGCAALPAARRCRRRILWMQIGRVNSNSPAQQRSRTTQSLDA